MIGSVHGCVSCPVVVRPWEPESLSRPQHPLPSHPNPQSQTYSFSQRSSSVHPFPQTLSPDDKKKGRSLSLQKHVSDEVHYQSQPDAKAKTEPSKPASPANMVSGDKSPQKSGSAADSPRKKLAVFRSQQAVSEQYEQLLGPKTTDVINVNTSSQKTVDVHSAGPGGDRSRECGQGKVHYIESQIRESEPGFSPSELVDKSKCQPLSAATKVSHSTDVMEVLQDRGLRSSTPELEQLSNSSGIGSSAQFHGLSPTPLPSIQDRSKMLTRGELSRELSQVSLVSSLRLNKVLPSISNQKLQPLKKAAFLPPRPSLSLRKERKHQIQAPRKKKSGKFDESVGESVQKIKLRGKGVSSLQGSQLTSSDTVPGTLATKMVATASTDSIKQQCRSIPEFTLQRKVDGPPHTFAEATTSPPHPRRDAPTPQSLDSSVWSIGQNAVVPEVDALTTAAAAGDLKKVRSLIAEGVNVNAVNTFGRTAVQVMSVNNTDLAEVLLKAGADPNMQDKGRRAATSTLRTIAHDVADSGNTDMLCCLLRHGADVSLQDRWGNTPLHLAAKGGHLAAVRLLRRGTSLYLANLDGKTPIMLLEEKNDSAIKEWVRMKKSTISRLQTMCILVLRRELGPDGLQHWRKSTSDVSLQRQVLLQNQGTRSHPCASTSTIVSSQHSAGSRSLVARGRGNGNGHPLLPGMSTGKQMTDFLSLRDLIPRRLSAGENTSLEVHNNSGQSYDDVSFGAQATSSLASEAGSLFEANLSSIEASQSADDLSLPSFDQSL